MPQREFWTQQHPMEVRWTYRADVLEAEGDSRLTISVYDQAGKLMEHNGVAVPFDETHELVATALVESWEGWLFGDRHAGPRALAAVGQRFARARAKRRLLGLLPRS